MQGIYSLRQWEDFLGGSQRKCHCRIEFINCYDDKQSWQYHHHLIIISSSYHHHLIIISSYHHHIIIILSSYHHHIIIKSWYLVWYSRHSNTQRECHCRNVEMERSPGSQLMSTLMSWVMIMKVMRMMMIIIIRIISIMIIMSMVGRWSVCLLSNCLSLGLKRDYF